MNKGFTLIELLVVVLIIGILAAIALPQYTRAVERSRMAEAVQILGDLATAESIHYMQNNRFIVPATGTPSGDMTLTLPTSTWTVSGAAQGDSIADGIVLTAHRDDGMYSGGELYLSIATSGAITKCRNDVAGFSAVADSMGYSTEVENAQACGAE